MEQQQCRALQEERDEARAGQLNERCKLEALQVALEEERQTWTQQEHKLKEHLRVLQEEGQTQLEREKVEVAIGRVGKISPIGLMRCQNMEVNREQGQRIQSYVWKLRTSGKVWGQQVRGRPKSDNK